MSCCGNMGQRDASTRIIHRDTLVVICDEVSKTTLYEKYLARKMDNPRNYITDKGIPESKPRG